MPLHWVSWLHSGYASQLEARGEWHWAVFVLLHLSDPEAREKAVRDALERHCSCDLELGPREAFVVEDLKVPKEWVYSAKVSPVLYTAGPHTYLYTSQISH